MPPYMCWVLESFRHVLVDHCDEYFDTSDRGNDKSRSKLITRVANHIAAIAQAKQQHVPDDLEKCVRIWFSNYAGGNAKEPRTEKSKVDTRGHPTSSKMWTAKSVSAHIFAEWISTKQRKLSNDGKKDIRKYRPTLAKVFNKLTEAEVKQCEDLAVEWNTKPLPDEMQCKLLKNILTEVTEFLKFMKSQAGAVFIAFAAYTNEDSEQTYARYEMDGLNFFGSRPEHQKGPINIVDMWKDFNLETAEEADSHEALEYDDEGNLVTVHGGRFYKLTGRIPWTDIAENPSHYLSKKSRHDCDHKLKEPSHMKSDGIDAWLQHWLKLQKKKKRPLELKDPSHKSSESLATTTAVPRRKVKGSKDQYIKSDDSDDQESLDEADNGQSNEDLSNTVLPPSPSSVSLTWKDRCTFLQSLSDDKKYRKLITLLGAAKDGDLLEGTPPTWVTWDSTDNYLPSSFYRKKSPVLLLVFKHWISMDPITADGDMLASYNQVELVILGFGLAFRALWVVQFLERFSDVPTYILKSSYLFSEYEQLSHDIDSLISRYSEIILELEAAYRNVVKPWTKENDVVGDQDIAGRNSKKVVDNLSKRRPHGLASVPAPLQHLREEVVLSGLFWESSGTEWKSLAALWLRTEILLAKSCRTNLSFTQIRESSILDEWKEWMNSKLMNIDAKRPAESFGKAFLRDYH
ncbi:hypothetical protein PILCRDRAFT_15545 [Piloderma croceum F 1598]|uniref:Uncharacterized protein n=1 Tax=Piloderma croceum (strain F 1598) TaxID=765440 RepID=A0A0C3EZC1_PILCF|nr:hypothetical protein PILCRDRAFT_15545 [Piloderma croceum F 1598]